jgi:hypothetical protein
VWLGKFFESLSWSTCRCWVELVFSSCYFRFVPHQLLRLVCRARPGSSDLFAAECTGLGFPFPPPLTTVSVVILLCSDQRACESIFGVRDSLVVSPSRARRLGTFPICFSSHRWPAFSALARVLLYAPGRLPVSSRACVVRTKGRPDTVLFFIAF